VCSSPADHGGHRRHGADPSGSSRRTDGAGQVVSRHRCFIASPGATRRLTTDEAPWYDGGPVEQ
jgi:hypothetical protein